jgi:hypothetical protein
MEENQAQLDADIREIEDAAAILTKVLHMHQDSREFALARTKLEEAVMWAIKGVEG